MKMLVIGVSISDPWDWVTENGSGPFVGEVVANVTNHVLVRLKSPIQFADVENVFVLSSTRHAGDSYSNLTTGLRLPSNFLPVPESAISTQGGEAMLRDALTFAEAWRRGFLVGALEVMA